MTSTHFHQKPLILRCIKLSGLTLVLISMVLLISPKIHAMGQTPNENTAHIKSNQPHPANPANPKHSQLAFEFKDINTGKSITETSGSGKILVVNFWATWCPPCVKEIPDMVKLQNEHPDKIQFIGIEVSSSTQKIKQFINEKRISYPIVRLDSGHINLPTPSGIPTTYVFDEHLNLLDTAVGFRDEAYFRSFIK